MDFSEWVHLINSYKTILEKIYHQPTKTKKQDNMKRTYTIILTMLLVALFAATGAMAQETGDFRSAADGDWSASATWESFDGTDWNAASAAPDGSENISIQGEHTVSVDDDVTISGYVTVEGLGTDEGGLVEISGGSFTVADGGTYQHDRDGGSIPLADWQDGSTIVFTGITGNGPGDRDQEYYNITWNNPDQASNINLGYETVTIGGTIRVIDSGSARLHLTDAGSGDGQTITIEGDVIVEGGQFTTTGSGGAATYETVVMGNVEVHENANLAPSRGSGGISTWNLHGDFTVAAGATLQNSNSEDLGGFTFVADTTGEATQKVHIEEGVSYNGAINLIVPEGSVIEIEDGSQLYTERTLRNSGGSIIANGEVIFGNGSTYEHARDGGSVPTATWAEGSTALFTGIEGSGPENASQDFYNLVLNSPDNASNNHFDMDGNTINGDIEVISTGNARLYLTNVAFEEEREITIMGDIHMHSGAFTTNGTGNGNSLIEVHHYGDITVDDGNFSISRGSGPLVHWNMYEGSIFFNGGETQNSNPRSGSAFIFTGEDTTQVLDVSEDVNIQHLPWTVDTLATLDIRESNFDGMSDNIELRAGGALATSFADGFEDNLNSQNLSLSSEAHYILNGTEEQQTGFSLPLVIASLTIDNEAGVTQSRDITITEFLRLANGVFDNSMGFELDLLTNDAELIIENGSSAEPIEGFEPLPIPEPPYAVGDTVNYNGSFSIDTELGDTEAEAWLIEGTDDSSWEIVDDAADDDDRALAFTVVHSGSDWFSNQAVNEPINVVEGDQYRASINLKGDEDGRIVRFYAGVPGEGGWERVRGWDTPELELTTEWQEFDFEFTATADHEAYGMRLATEFNTEDNDGGVIFIDDAVLEKLEAVSNEIVEEIPSEYTLEQNYPNPFNPSTNIQFKLPEQANVSLQVYDISGRQIAVLVDGNMNAGSHTIEWNASNLASGVYLYRITAGDFTAVRKLTIVK